MNQALRYMAVSALCFSVMGACTVHLRETFGAAQVVFARSAVCVVWMLLVMPRTRRAYLGSRPGLLALRGVLGFVALQLYFEALGRIPYADAAALLYTSPVWTFVFAAWFLREPVTRAGACALALCLLGSAAILQPGFATDLMGSLFGLGAGVLAGAAYVSVRALARTEPDHTILLWFPLLSLPCAAGLMAPNYVAPTAAQWGGLILVGLVSQLGQIYLTKALRAGNAGPASTGYFLSLALAALWGWFAFGQIPTTGTWLGTAAILAGLWVIGRAR